MAEEGGFSSKMGAAGGGGECTGGLAEKTGDRVPDTLQTFPRDLQGTCFPVLDGKPAEWQSGMQT